MTQTPRAPLPTKPLPLKRNGLSPLPSWLLSLAAIPAGLILPFLIGLSNGALPLSAGAADAIGIVLLILFGVLFVIFLRAGRGLIPLLVLLGFLLVQLTQSFLSAAFFIGLLFAVGTGSLLVAVSKRETLTRLPLILLVTYALSVLLCRDLLLALTGLLPFPAAVALAFGTRASAGSEDGPGRVGVICLTSLTFGLSAAAVAALLLWRRLGSLSLSTLTQLVDALREQLCAAVADAMRAMNDQVKEPVFDVTEESVTNLVNGFINLLPAGLVVLCNLTAALGQMILHALLCSVGFSGSVRGRVKVFRMSLVSCIVFLTAYVVGLVAVGAGGSSTLVGTVAENVAIILHPGLALCGIIRFLVGMTRGGRRGGCFVFFLFIFIFIIPYIFLFMPFYEAVAAIIGAIVSRIRPKTPDGGSGSDPDGDGTGGNDASSGF